MKIPYVFLCISLFFSSRVVAQEKDLKGIYTDVITAINSALLTKSGSVELSGCFSYNSFSTNYTDDEKINQQILRIEPEFLYFFFDNISLGLAVSYLNQKTDFKISDDPETIEQTFAGPVAKMYFGEDRFRPFISTDYLFMAGDNYKGGVFDIGAGLFYHVTGNFGFSLSCRYGFMSAKNDNINSQNRLLLGMGISNFHF